MEVQVCLLFVPQAIVWICSGLGFWFCPSAYSQYYSWFTDGRNHKFIIIEKLRHQNGQLPSPHPPTLLPHYQCPDQFFPKHLTILQLHVWELVLGICDFCPICHHIWNTDRSYAWNPLDKPAYRQIPWPVHHPCSCQHLVIWTYQPLAWNCSLSTHWPYSFLGQAPLPAEGLESRDGLCNNRTLFPPRNTALPSLAMFFFLPILCYSLYPDSIPVLSGIVTIGIKAIDRVTLIAFVIPVGRHRRFFTSVNRVVRRCRSEPRMNGSVW